MVDDSEPSSDRVLLGVSQLKIVGFYRFRHWKPIPAYKLIPIFGKILPESGADRGWLPCGRK
jgi:hypothetical protein